MNPSLGVNIDFLLANLGWYMKIANMIPRRIAVGSFLHNTCTFIWFFMLVFVSSGQDGNDPKVKSTRVLSLKVTSSRLVTDVLWRPLILFGDLIPDLQQGSISR